MRRVTFFLLLFTIVTAAAARQPVITFGKPLPVKRFVGPAERSAIQIQVRPLYVNGKLREFTTGEPHEVTDRIFVVRHAYRLNDQLPEDAKPSWRWQLGTWLIIDRQKGSIRKLTLPHFDPFYSAASWYRDYVGYCGISDEGDKVLAVVAQIGQKKPLVNKELGEARAEEVPESECARPKWQRDPIRVTFEPRDRAPVTFDLGSVAGAPAAQPATAQRAQPHN